MGLYDLGLGLEALPAWEADHLLERNVESLELGVDVANSHGDVVGGAELMMVGVYEAWWRSRQL